MKEDAAEIGRIHVALIPASTWTNALPPFLPDERARRWTEEGKGVE